MLTFPLFCKNSLCPCICAFFVVLRTSALVFWVQFSSANSPESTVAKCSPYYSLQSVCAGYALAQSGNVVPSRTPTSLCSPTSKLLPPYAAHTQAFFSLKINFRSKHLCMCIFFCTFGRRLLEGNSYLAMLERIFQHSPEITVA